MLDDKVEKSVLNTLIKGLNKYANKKLKGFHPKTEKKAEKKIEKVLSKYIDKTMAKIFKA